MDTSGGTPSRVPRRVSTSILRARRLIAIRLGTEIRAVVPHVLIQQRSYFLALIFEFGAIRIFDLNPCNHSDAGYTRRNPPIPLGSVVPRSIGDEDRPRFKGTGAHNVSYGNYLTLSPA